MEEVACERWSVVSYHYKWTLANFRSLLENSPFYQESEVCSDIFKVGVGDWCLLLSRNRCLHHQSSYCFEVTKTYSLYVKLVASPGTVEVEHCELGLTREKTLESFTSREVLILKPGDKYGKRDFIKDCGDALNLCDITLFCNLRVRDREDRVNSLRFPLDQLFNNRQFSDVAIKVKGQTFYAYKGILATRSKVFAAMFGHDLLEKSTSVVKIEDMASDVFLEVLRYIYTDQCQRVEEMAPDLLAAADKYDLVPLKELCSDHLAASINVQNSAETLLIADSYGLEVVTSKVTEFIKNNLDAVLETEGWRAMVRRGRHPVFGLLQSFKKKQSGVEPAIKKVKKSGSS